MAPNSRGIAMVEQDRQKALDRAAYHRARLAPLDQEERLDDVTAVFAKNAHVAGLLASPSTRDSIIGDPLIMILKGGWRATRREATACNRDGDKFHVTACSRL
jgi:hypothetical protein